MQGPFRVLRCPSFQNNLEREHYVFKDIEYLQYLPFSLLKFVCIVCFHPYMSCWGSWVIKSLMVYFDVFSYGRLHSIFIEDDVATQGSMLPICILWKNGKKQILKPHPNDIISLFKLCFYENKSIDHLLWDLGEWKWQITSTQGIVGKQIPFFQYFVKMGRELRRRGLVVVPTIYKF